MKSVIAAALCCVTSAHVSYEGHQVFRTIPETQEQLRGLLEMNTVDFWLEPSQIGRRVDIRVDPARPEILASLASLNLSLNLHISDVEQHLNESFVTVGDDTWDSAYHNIDDINQWLTSLAASAPDIASTFKLGQTYEGRTVMGIKVSAAPAGSPQIMLDGGIHAREWIAPAVVQHIIGQLVSGYGSDSDVTQMVDTAEWYLVPVLNADGYVYTWEHDRLWRKNRQPNKGSFCIGTDPCRNADAGFGGGGSSGFTCDETYHGSAPWSTPIMQAWKDFVTTLSNFKGYVNFHSYADSWLQPYGYTTKRPKDYASQEALGKAVTTAIKAVHGTSYAYGPASTTIYTASGIPSDWAYDNLGVVYSQACELSGNSFSPPPSLIKPNGEEIFAGMKVLHSAVVSQEA